MLIFTTLLRQRVSVWNQAAQIQHVARFHGLPSNATSLFTQYYGTSFRSISRKLNVRSFVRHGLSTRRTGTSSSNGFITLLSGTLAVGTVICYKQYTKAVFCQGSSKKTTRRNRVNGMDENNNSTAEISFPWKEFFKLLLPDIWYLAGAILSALAVAFINIKIPLMLGDVVNVLASYARNELNNLAESLGIPASRLLYMYLMQGLLTGVYISLLSSVGERLAARMRCKLFQSTIVQDMAFFDATKTGDLINRLTTDVQDFKSSFKMCVSQGLKNLAQTLGCLVSLFVISPHLTIFMGGAVTSIIAIGSFMGSGLRKLSRLAQAQVSNSTAVADEAFGNIRTVRAFAMEPMEIELFTYEVERSSHLNQMLGVGIGVFQGLSNVALNGMVLGTLYVGGHLMSQNSISAGDLMSFLVATQTIQRSLGQMSLLFGQAVRGISAGCRVFEYILIRPSMNISGGETIPKHTLTGQVQFSGVDFSYPTRPNQRVLEKFSLNIEGGKMVALVGLSGGGKSTVASLLERFYDVDSGSITLDGHDIRSLDPSWLRGQVIGFINQEPVLFATTVMENIRYGLPSATDEEVIEAAKLANAHNFIETFPEGYSTVLGERGVTVSGGQKQRIAIARALIKSPSVLILDEATSALDSESEGLVQEALERVSKDRTVLVIAHRLSTIKDADVIAVVSNGRIVESGTHEELRDRGGIYWNLIKNQDLNNSNNQSRNNNHG